ncbi:MAG: hypothetical protein CUN55_09240 [Phototrophicales bacterium]|nr:MAG: hypothetical protein CUN55_09240 [Phototrophicales bacterium]
MSKKRTSTPNIPQDALERARRELQQGTSSTGASATQGEVVRSTRPAKKEQTEGTIVYSSKKQMMTREELAQEYSYVLKDLTSMAILAAFLFVVLIVVSLVAI